MVMDEFTTIKDVRNNSNYIAMTTETAENHDWEIIIKNAQIPGDPEQKEYETIEMTFFHNYPGKMINFSTSIMGNPEHLDMAKVVWTNDTTAKVTLKNSATGQLDYMIVSGNGTGSNNIHLKEMLELQKQ